MFITLDPRSTERKIEQRGEIFHTMDAKDLQGVVRAERLQSPELPNSSIS